MDARRWATGFGSRIATAAWPSRSIVEPKKYLLHDRKRAITLTNDIAVERLVRLLKEFVAQDELPAR